MRRQSVNLLRSGVLVQKSHLSTQFKHHVNFLSKYKPISLQTRSFSSPSRLRFSTNSRLNLQKESPRLTHRLFISRWYAASSPGNPGRNTNDVPEAHFRGGPKPTATSPPAAETTSDSDLIYDVDESTFQDKVVNASLDTPIILDCHAEWCGPCKVLGPILEQEVTKANGAVKLAKLNVDENKNIAQQLRIQSIPFVLVVFQGKIIDQFVGSKPQRDIEALVTRLKVLSEAPPDAEDESLQNENEEEDEDTPKKKPKTQRDQFKQILEEAEAHLQAGRISDAAARFSAVLNAGTTDIQMEPLALAGLARTALAEQNLETAKELIASLKQKYPEKTKTIEVAMAISAVDLADLAQKEGIGGGGKEKQKELEKELEKNPENHAARYEYAFNLFLGGNSEKAVDQILDLLRRDRRWNNEAARRLLLRIFDVLGSTSPVVIRARKQFSAIWFSG